MKKRYSYCLFNDEESKRKCTDDNGDGLAGSLISICCDLE